ncbi:MAG TPA: hypothetical protein VHJ99_04365 [Candidatus Dormibacteraeota bacterium]|nr:hypothetical protein [Candidatus Dormibacteraeota bacterium]
MALIAIVVAIAAALMLGAGLGYTLKGATVVSGPARVVVVGNQSSSQPGADACIRVDNHKAC